MITIHNEHLSVVIDPHGAQLQSIHSHGREYLWQGNPAVWPNRSPVLFPLCARMRDKQYAVDGKMYTVEPHGFAKFTDFEVTRNSPESVTFSTSQTAETLAVYPFDFKFSLTYTLEGNKILKRYHVENTADTPLYYEAGGHDGYNVPFNAGETMADCKVRMPGMESFSPYEADSANILLPKERDIATPGGLMELKPGTYNVDIVTMDSPVNRRAEILDGNGDVRIAVDFADIDYITIWSKNDETDCNFVCVEPWSSLPDAQFVSRELKDKAGVRCLAGGESETIGYDITIY